MSPDPPLRGRRLLVTRGLEKGDLLAALLEEAGATVVRVPLIEPVQLVSDVALQAAFNRLRGAAGRGASQPWVVLTSETAVTLVARALGEAALAQVRVAAVGPATAAALRARGIEADLVAPGQEADSLAADLGATEIAGVGVLVVAAAGGRDVVAPVLRSAGAEVEVVEAYRSVMPEGATETLRAVAGTGMDAVTFTSGSTVRHFAAAIAEPPPWIAACIGPVTAEAARRAGWERIVVAREHTAAGLAAVMIERLGGAHPLP